MRPMTASEAWQIERDPYAAPDDFEQARRILGALVECREADLACDEEGPGVEARIKKRRAVERKLAALERGETPEES